jgi:hypothetical protein
MQVQTSEWDFETTMVDSSSLVILSTVRAKACLVFTPVTSLQELPKVLLTGVTRQIFD